MRYSLCNELFGALPFERQCQLAAEHGFEGLEIAPFTIADEDYRFPDTLSRTLKSSLDDNGLAFAGLHWLLTKPEGMSLTSPEKAKRQEAVDFLKRLLDFADSLGGGGLILGGPKQRSVWPSCTLEETISWLAESLHDVGEYGRICVSRILIEPLSPDQTNVINTFAETRKLLRKADSDGLSAMFDYHNTAGEADSWASLAENNRDIIRHVHVNTMKGGYPTKKDLPEYAESLKCLSSNRNIHWASLEVFGSMPYEKLLAEYGDFVSAVRMES